MSIQGWFSGPVAITGASGQVGRALQQRLTVLPNEVRALGRLDDPMVAFRDASAVVHLAGTLRPKRPNTYEGANLDTVAATVAALKGSGARRVVFLSYLDADPASDNPYLRAKGQAEEMFRALDVPVVIFRAPTFMVPRKSPGRPWPPCYPGRGRRCQCWGRAPSVMPGSAARM